MNAGMSREEFLDALRLMSGEVIDDDVDLLSARLTNDEVGQEGHELFAGVARRRHAEDFTAAGIESGVERKSAVAVVLKPMALRPAGREGKNGIEAVQSLDRSLLVDAEHGGML